ncbi:MAG: hypothetical protein QOE70_3825 [Chthoniobacter sp.]|jgi:hypothetical protein|nr:hypothetical protein [Chthoniobacter sp.]
MIHQERIGKITSLIAALRQHVKTQSDVGFNDVSASIELWVKQILAITEGLDLQNQNLVHMNFPAIDLADKKRQIAIQVTSNVTPQKWMETVRKFEAHGLDKVYTSLRIIGFCSAVKPRSCPPYVVVQGPSSLLSPLKTLAISQLEGLEELLRGSYDFSKLNPLSDRDCFTAVLNVLDRDALRHSTRVEGSYENAVKGLIEIKEVITCGTVRGKAIYAKPIGQYSEPFSTVLRTIDCSLSMLLAELNRARNGFGYFLNERQETKMDAIRKRLVEEVNQFCALNNIRRKIEIID